MQENYELIQKGFRILHPFMAGYIAQELNRNYHGAWWQEVLNALYDQRDLPNDGDYGELLDSLDIANCLRLIERKWNDVFRSKLSINYRTWAKELMGVRNTVAHIGQQDISQSDAERALDTMARLCEAFDKDGAEEIRDIYKSIRYSKHEEIQDISVGPKPIDVIPAGTSSSVMRSGRVENLLKLVGTDMVQATTLTRKVTFAGKTEAYPVYKVRLDALFYNDQNDRIATWITRYASEHGVDALSSLVGEEYNQVIENFIFESNPESIQKTQKNIALVGQREPGVALADGRIVDGNRRFTCLRRIQRDSTDVIYFETVIMDVDIRKDKKQIKLLELAIQHGEEKKVDYDLIDYAMGTYMDIVKTKLLTIDEYAASTNESVSEVKKRIDCAQIVCEFLDYLKLSGQYHIAREYQVYSLFQEMMAPLRQLSGDERQQLKIIAFNNVMMRALLDQRKFIRDIKGLIKNETYAMYFDDQMEINRKIHQFFDDEQIRSRQDIDGFAQRHENITEELQLSLQKALLRSRKQQLKAKPSENVAKSVSLMTDVDSRMFGKLDEAERKSLKREMDELATVVGNYSAILGGNSTPSTNSPMVRESSVAYASTTKYNKFTLAESNPGIPFVVCVNAGKTITRFFVTLRFKAVALSEEKLIDANCKVFFIDENGNTISDVREFTLEAGSETSANISMRPDSLNLKKCQLVIQEKNGAADEALQLIPFDLNITSGFRR